MTSADSDSSDSMASLRPLVVICGTTGVGKSKLAIELALRLARPSSGRRHPWRGARIINADSMQVYKGMDVITNKVPLDEQQGVEHLLMGFKEPGEQYVVGEWVRDTIRVVDETYDMNKLPIVVGGTSYWIQHLLFPDRLPSAVKASPSPQIAYDARLVEAVSLLTPLCRELFGGLPKVPPKADTEPEAAFALYSLLKDIDELTASRWHWRDTRKVLRSLELMKETGKRASDLLSEQSRIAVVPRYRAICFWPYAEPASLFPRLDSRVDQMIQLGLLNEIQELRSTSRKHNNGSTEVLGSEWDLRSSSPIADFTQGIYQCIGYKEFRDYLAHEGSKSPSEQKLLTSAIDAMKLSTQQYAKRQISWLRNKFLPTARSANIAANQLGMTDIVPTYVLDATDVDHRWSTNVKDVAEHILEDFLEDKPLPNPLSLSERARDMLTISDKPIDPLAVLEARRRVICEACTTDPQQPVMIEEGKEWDAHRRTKVHKHRAKVQNAHDNPRAKRVESEALRRKRTVVVSNPDEDAVGDAHGLFVVTES